MKKYVWLAGVTAILAASVWGMGQWMKPQPVTVSVQQLQPQAVKETVGCNGKIESSESKGVYTEVPCVAREVFVKAGQKVNKGDVLFTVDKQATIEALATIGGISPDLVPTDNVKKEVTAPISGVITELSATRGEVTDAGKPCVTISPNDSLQVKVSIPERHIKKVAVGQLATVTGTAFFKNAYAGKVISVSPSARQQLTGGVSETIVDAVILLDKSAVDSSLRMGLTAKAEVVVNEMPAALVVPYECVLQDASDQEYVYLAQKGRAIKQTIITGEELRSGFQVVDGLQDGDILIKNPENIPAGGYPIHIKEED